MASTEQFRERAILMADCLGAFDIAQVRTFLAINDSEALSHGERLQAQQQMMHSDGRSTEATDDEVWHVLGAAMEIAHEYQRELMIGGMTDDQQFFLKHAHKNTKRGMFSFKNLSASSARSRSKTQLTQLVTFGFMAFPDAEGNSSLTRTGQAKLKDIEVARMRRKQNAIATEPILFENRENLNVKKGD